MATVEVDVRDQIVAFKRALAPNRDVLKRAFAEVRDHVKRAADRILREVDAGRPVIPELNYQDIRDGNVPGNVRQSIRSTGCVVVRDVFPDNLASDWFAQLGEYLQANRYDAREVEKRNLDKYFAGLKAAKPQIFNVYGSSRRSWPARMRDLPRPVRFSIACGSTKGSSIRTCSARMRIGRDGDSPGIRRLVSRHTWTPIR